MIGKYPFRFNIKPLLFALFIALTFGSAGAKTVVNDVTQINPILVDQVITPTTIEQIQKAVVAHKGKISIGGGRYSMGGQTATENALQIDMRQMNKMISLDEKNKKITVQAGIRWRDIQDAIDPHDLSIKIMQTYSNFTVGGSLSVNVHGRYIGQGPLIRSVDSIKVVLADGTLVEASPSKNSEVFYGAIGGYGGLGVIVEATLQLADNGKVERVAKVIPMKDYRKYFFSEIRDNDKAVFHNGDIYPPEYEKVNSVTWYKTDKPLTIQDRLIPRNQKYKFQPWAISTLTSMPMGSKLRSSVLEPYMYKTEMVTWRNHEASYDVAELEPSSRKNTTYVLQEYFIPVEKFEEFIPKMRDVFNKYNADIFNVSIRHALPDPGSLLAWARNEVFAFVVYYRQGTSPDDKQVVGNWTREMISQIISVGGAYYLPYQIHATDDQFHRAYPRYQDYFNLKKKLDPDYKFRNKLWDRYYLSMPDEIATEISKTEKYKRGEEQSFLALPEWYIVFNGDEYAQYLKENKPSGFPYFKSANEFWHLKSEVKKITTNKYPFNMGYNVMLWVIGSSYTVELWIKGIYENTIGRITEALTSEAGTDEDRNIQKINQQYADFIHVYPFYEFSYFNCLKQFWSESSWLGSNFIRKWERKIFFTLEFTIKTIYGGLIRTITKMSYETEPMEIYAVIDDPQGNSQQFPEIKKIKSFDSFHLVMVPRYDGFRELIKKLSGKNIRFIEVAGNRQIFLTAIADRRDKILLESGEVVGNSSIPTDASKERLLITTSVSSLINLVATLQENHIVIEHIFDY
jgi:FAD/FMN-containing dehydrogenase